MTRSRDLDTVAPDDVIEIKKQVIASPKVNTNVVEDGKKIEVKNEKSRIINNFAEDINNRVYGILGHTKHSLSSLLVNPHVFDFEERDVNEKIILVARPHWFTNVSWIITSILLVLAPSLLGFLPIIEDIPIRFQTIGVLVWYLITFAFTFEKFLSWYFDVYIITDERIIDISFNNLLNKKFSEAKLSMIQDITSRVNGVAQTMLNYGTVYIQTAAEVAEIQFEMIPNPEKIIKVLQLLRQEEERETLEGRVR